MSRLFRNRLITSEFTIRGTVLIHAQTVHVGELILDRSSCALNKRRAPDLVPPSYISLDKLDGHQPLHLL
jgi:hypothetical protein